jgi:hypothetical protein
VDEDTEERADQKPSTSQPPDPGVFVTKGMSIDLSEHSITMYPDGRIEASPIRISTELNLCPYWLEIAFQHLLAADSANDRLMAAKLDKAPEAIADALQEEFVAGMQTIMASAIALDAYYACIKERANVPAELTASWRTNGTARYKQIAEVLRRAFPMPEEAGKTLREALREITRFRDKAVHPPAGTTAPVLHPELDKVTDWRFVWFRFYNAKAATGLALSIVSQTAGLCPTDAPEALGKYCATVLERIQPLISRWEERFGKLGE